MLYCGASIPETRCGSRSVISRSVTRQMIAREVWREPNRATPLDNVIDVHLAHLRRKLDGGESVKLIQTVRGVGFVLRAEADA